MSSLDFFVRHFRRQIDAADYALNSFERAALPYLRGSVLELGCGLGNLALAAAAQDARVTAIDVCEPAVDDLRRRAVAAGLAIDASAQDLRAWRPERTFDAVSCIGLLMFFPGDAARTALSSVRAAVAPGGVAAVNVLVEGTTYLEMFGTDPYCLFEPGELAKAFAGWNLALDQHEEFLAPDGTVKRFETVIARRPRPA